MQSDQDLYNELSCYTLSHPDPSFIHQHVVDAYAAQKADEHSKPIGIVFALVGLYLYVEKNFTSRQVQQVHMQMARKRKTWPKFTLPEQKGNITVSDVMNVPPGIQRDEMIQKWCASVWEAWKDCRNQVLAIIENELEITQ
jgi:hypothetical protein